MSVPVPRRRTALRLLPALLALAAPALLLTGCGDEQTRRIGEVREIGGERPDGMRAASAEERFGRAGHGQMGPQAARPAWLHDLPEGWSALPPVPGRDLGWSAPGGVEVTFTALPQSGGGLLANVNRWRNQMQLDPVEEAALAELEEGVLLGQPAKKLDLEGTYVGMGRGEPVENARMMGLLAVLPQAAVFLKMYGPSEAVRAQEAAFHQLAESIRPAPAPMAGMPPGHGMRAPGSPPAGGGQASLAWDLPAGWKVAAGKTAFRESTFRPEGSEAEVWVSVAGGGLVDNVARWRAQMGQPPLSPAEVEALPKLEAMGREGTLVTIEGTYNAGMGGGGGPLEDAVMLAFALPMGDQSVFVKMIGPADEVRSQKENFVAFSRSLRQP